MLEQTSEPTPDPTDELCAILARNRAGEAVGLTSVCSAHPEVIAASLALSRARRQLAVIEATCNQVNQEGGYTGMTPARYAALVRAAAAAASVEPGQLVLGGDHLGPQPWRSGPAGTAMTRAEAMVADYVAAGFTKIHLDCSMPCADDPPTLSEETIARRAARLLATAERAAAEAGAKPVYVIGTEVPAPGGMGEGHAIVPTDPDAVSATWEAHRSAFAEAGLSDALERIIGVVVQPGLDFGNEDIVHFAPSAAGPLSAAVRALPGAVFEAHSTDYQRPAAYRALVAGHFAILKVGPALTFAYREAVYGLEAIAHELGLKTPSVRGALETAMLAEPGYWQGHYAGDPDHEAYLRHFSPSDRLRYYWTEPKVAAAVETLFAALSQKPLPLSLVSQVLPQLAPDVLAETLAPEPQALARAAIARALAPYADACGTHF